MHVVLLLIKVQNLFLKVRKPEGILDLHTESTVTNNPILQRVPVKSEAVSSDNNNLNSLDL